MSNTNTGGPVFPTNRVNISGEVVPDEEGMTLRQYAAIKLRVPNSGTDWLDEMIVQSLRDEFAAKAPFPYPEEWKRYYCNQRGYRGEAQCMADWSYDWADALLKAREA